MSEDLFDTLLDTYSGFREFVEEQKDKTVEEIANEFGVIIPKSAHEKCTRKSKI